MYTVPFKIDTGISNWAIAGIVTGSVVLVGALVGAYFCCKKQKQQEPNNLQQSEATETPYSEADYTQCSDEP